MVERGRIVVIGSGVIGLAVAAELARRVEGDVIVLERRDGFGQETSSRNSEVIHAGIYYPPP
jgi:L-2-hydroxyglutarate oxidase LhgO